ncbi:MAG TPA: nucleoside triphosphate pyrophosphohydrolase, partial [Psychrobacter sp.]|nr:nucleoside triphosphate pyrophosphohydrolase [Psychrobacter sp.]
MSILDNKITVPKPVQGTPEANGEFDDLLALMARLRADCPWDRKQTNHSLIPYAIEEAYELGEAVQSDDDEDIKGELGDVLLQVIFHCQMYAEQGRFDMSDVITTLQEKLVRRHPHVFEAETLKDDAAVKIRWDEIKAEEQQAREARGKSKRRLDNVKAGSALMQAQNVQK